MKSAAIELGQHNITVNALIPGLVDTALTRYEKRLSESMGEQGQKVEHPTPQQAWDNGRRRSRSRSAGFSRTTYPRLLCFSLPMLPTWSPARNTKSPAAIARRTSSQESHE